MGSGQPLLKYFTQPAILEQIGPKRLKLLLRDFADDLKATQLVLPSAEVHNGDYFVQLAATFAAPECLPDRLRQALLTLEEAASPANEKRAWGAIKRRIPGISVSHDCALDRVLELWFLARDEFSQFVPPKAEQPPVDGDEHPSSPPSVAGLPRRTSVAGLRRGDELTSDSVTSCSTTENSGADVSAVPSQAKTNVSETPADMGEDDCPATDSTIQPFNDSTSAENDEQTFLHLAQLSPAQYDRARPGAAQRLGIRMETLDSEVARRRADVQASAVKLPFIEPWPEPVDGAQVLHEVAARFSLHVVFPPGAAHATTLWDAHAHAFEAFLHTPRLNLSSPGPECGKTTTLDLLATMTPRALRTENLTAPVLFRLVAQHRPTLLLDELDTYLTSSDELRGLLNAGHKRGACAYRCEGEGNAVRAFNAFAPAVLSGIGELPETLLDRSIRIWLLPAEPEQVKANFDSRHHEIETVLCRKLARWAKDNFAALETCDPVMPAGCYNRRADNWRPLFAIAQIAGGDWPRLALEAYHHLAHREEVRGQKSVLAPNLASRRSPTKADQLSTRDSQLLLAAIRQVFTQTGTTRISSKQLVAALNQQSTLNPQLTTTLLAASLHPFGIHPRTLRIGTHTIRGYELADFTDAFSRLPHL